MTRHHIRRQRGPHSGAQRAHVDKGAGGGHDVGHQLLHVAHRLEHHRGGTATQLLHQCRFDLAQLDAKTAHFHLIVRPAQAMDLALVVDARHVAGAVETGFAGMRHPRVGDEFFGGQLGPSEIAVGDARPDDAQLAGLSGRKQIHRLVDHQQPVVGQRLADGDRLAGVQLSQTGRDRGFGRPVGVEHPSAIGRPAVDHGLRADLAAEVDQPQPRHVGGKQGQQGGHRMQHGDLVVRQRAGQGVGVGDDLARPDPQAGADQIGDPDLLEGHVEGDRKALIDPVVAAHAEDRVFAAQKVADCPLGDRHALGLAGRAGGVDHIGGVVRARALAAQQRGVGGLEQSGLIPDRAAGIVQSGEQAVAADDADGLRVFEAHGDAVDRRVGVEGQPCGAGLGDGQLAHQQVDAAGQPQADDVARPHAAADQVMSHQAGTLVEFAVADPDVAENQRGMVGLPRGGGLE